MLRTIIAVTCLMSLHASAHATVYAGLPAPCTVDEVAISPFECRPRDCTVGSPTPSVGFNYQTRRCEQYLERPCQIVEVGGLFVNNREYCTPLDCNFVFGSGWVYDAQNRTCMHEQELLAFYHGDKVAVPNKIAYAPGNLCSFSEMLAAKFIYDPMGSGLIIKTILLDWCAWYDCAASSGNPAFVSDPRDRTCVLGPLKSWADYQAAHAVQSQSSGSAASSSAAASSSSSSSSDAAPVIDCSGHGNATCVGNACTCICDEGWSSSVTGVQRLQFCTVEHIVQVLAAPPSAPVNASVTVHIERDPAPVASSITPMSCLHAPAQCVQEYPELVACAAALTLVLGAVIGFTVGKYYRLCCCQRAAAPLVAASAAESDSLKLKTLGSDDEHMHRLTSHLIAALHSRAEELLRPAAHAAEGKRTETDVEAGQGQLGYARLPQVSNESSPPAALSPLTGITIEWAAPKPSAPNALDGSDDESSPVHRRPRPASQRGANGYVFDPTAEEQEDEQHADEESSADEGESEPHRD